MTIKGSPHNPTRKRKIGEAMRVTECWNLGSSYVIEGTSLQRGRGVEVGATSCFSPRTEAERLGNGRYQICLKLGMQVELETGILRKQIHRSFLKHDALSQPSLFFGNVKSDRFCTWVHWGQGAILSMGAGGSELCKYWMLTPTIEFQEGWQTSLMPTACCPLCTS